MVSGVLLCRCQSLLQDGEALFQRVALLLLPALLILHLPPALLLQRLELRQLDLQLLTQLVMLLQPGLQTRDLLSCVDSLRLQPVRLLLSLIGLLSDGLGRPA